MCKKLYFLLLFPLAVFGQSQDKNYAKTTTYKQAVSQTIPQPSASQASISVTYFDGLGRPIQNVQNKQSASGNDIITHIEYDGLGRNTIDFLPHESGSNDMLFDPQARSNTIDYYNTEYYENTQNPYTEKLYDSSPLGRILKESAPGTEWRMGSGHEVRYEHLFNSDVEVRLLAANTSSSGNPISDHGFYESNQLYKKITKNENWTSGTENTTEEFIHKNGQLLLKRTYGRSAINGSVQGNVKHDTYYVYDQYGNLAYVIPPLAEGAITQLVLDGLCYQYRYDERNRVIEKKLPGKQTEYLVYDRLDRLVATGPSLTPFGGAESGWIINKYDAYGRMVYNAWYNGQQANSAGRANLQSSVNNSAVTSESRISSNSIDNVLTRYTNNVFPTSGLTLLTINYYDNYDFPEAASVPNMVESQPILANAKGLQTGHWSRFLDSEDQSYGDISQFFYDTNGRQVRSYSTTYQQGVTEVDSKLNFRGLKEYIITRHRPTWNTTNDNYEIKENFSYSESERLLSHTHNLAFEMSLAQYEYDGLGMLRKKSVGGYLGYEDPYQNIDYKYNIRGWLTDINDVNNLTQGNDPQDLFALKINYNTVDSGIGGNVVPLYNGNISETTWVTSSDNALRRYGYGYDAMNRLWNAYYQKPINSTNPNYTGSYDESLTYDKNGNIKSLIRNGGIDDEVDVIDIDVLNYDYDNSNPNRLMKVTDTSNDGRGFKDGTNTGSDFEYDSFGNLLSDKNKGITEIIYNHLNLPTKIVFGDPYKRIDYIYDADGNKMNKVVTRSAPWQFPNIKSTNYFGNFQYIDGVLEFIATAEGYITPNEGYIFNHKDHLGNTRVSYSQYSPQMILKESNYYPFGLKHEGYNTVPVGEYSTNKYEYNGKEFQDELGLNMYDYGARNYDPAIGRWMNIDLHATNYYSLSPYNYVDNSPLRSVDPDGKDIIILSAPSHVGNLGHAAVLIGNSDDGYYFYSKNGTNDNLGVKGPSNKDPVTGIYYASLADFQKSKHNLSVEGSYTRGFSITTDKATDEKMKVAAKNAVKREYNLLVDSCIDVASQSLLAADLNPGFSENMFGVFHISPVPNDRFDQIVEDNPDGYLFQMTDFGKGEESKNSISIGIPETKFLQD